MRNAPWMPDALACNAESTEINPRRLSFGWDSAHLLHELRRSIASNNFFHQQSRWHQQMGDGRVNLFAERRAKALRKLDLRGGSTDKDAEKGSMWHNAVPGHAHELYEGVQKERSKSPQAARDCP